MTRAADRLIVGGCMPGNTNTVRKLCWYDLVGKGLAASGLSEETIETEQGVVKRYRAPTDTVAAVAVSDLSANSAVRENADKPSQGAGGNAGASRAWKGNLCRVLPACGFLSQKGQRTKS